MLPDYIKYRENEGIPDHIVILLGPINSVMINTQTNQITEMSTNELKGKIKETLQNEESKSRIPIQ